MRLENAVCGIVAEFTYDFCAHFGLICWKIGRVKSGEVDFGLLSLIDGTFGCVLVLAACHSRTVLSDCEMFFH